MDALARAALTASRGTDEADDVVRCAIVRCAIESTASYPSTGLARNVLCMLDDLGIWESDCTASMRDRGSDPDGADAEVTAFALRAALDDIGLTRRGCAVSPIVMGSIPGLATKFVVEMVDMARRADVERGVVLVGFPDEVDRALRA